MSLVEEYYELNEAEEVSVVWKILHILLYWCAAASGLWCGFTLALLRQKFDNKCYLFTEVETSTKYDLLDQCNINWKNDSWCDYCQYSMVSSFVVGIIWGTVFLMCGKGGKSLMGLPQPWRVVWPSLVFNFIYFLIALSTAINVHRGTEKFEDSFKSYEKISSKSLTENCDLLKQILKKSTNLLHIKIVVRTSWGCAFFWFILFLLSSCRILFVIDFRLYKICVFKIDDTVRNKKEEVLKITNYEEPKKLYFSNDELTTNPEHIPENLDLGVRKKVKTDKKWLRQNFTFASPMYKANSVFYQTTDIRTLNREKKRKKTSLALDESFGKNRTNFGFGVGKSFKMQANSDISRNSDTSTFLYQYSEELYEDDEDDASSLCTLQRLYFHNDWNASSSGSEIPDRDFDDNRFLMFKKQI